MLQVLEKKIVVKLGFHKDELETFIFFIYVGGKIKQTRFVFKSSPNFDPSASLFLSFSQFSRSTIQL